VAIGKVKETDLQQLLSQIQNSHAVNVEEAGEYIKNLGGKYPIPGLSEQLKKGWEAVASTKDSKTAIRLLQKKERDGLATYKELLKKASDEQTVQLILHNMADATQHVVQLTDKLSQLQGKKKKGFRLLGIPSVIWLLAAGGGGFYYWQQRNKETAAPASPAPAPSSSSSSTTASPTPQTETETNANA
jgi:hypothetical protein